MEPSRHSSTTLKCPNGMTLKHRTSPEILES
ncbi:hypothetical protein Tco_0239064, partial [Tanacetum coccineum]